MAAAALTVACVEVGDYCCRGAEYVQKLRAMVARHLPIAHRFVCLTDAPQRHAGVETIAQTCGLEGWWAKLALFAEGVFRNTRVIYFDLDTVIVGSIERLAEAKGIIHLRDWGWKQNDYGSGVMVWDAGEHGEAWALRNCGPMTAGFRGDQDWLTYLGGWPALPKPPYLCSAKYHCQDGPPEGAAVVCFHGPMKPHNWPKRRDWIDLAWC